MEPLSEEYFGDWMEKYGRFSKSNDARASSELFALDAQYYETPFAEPMQGREAIYQYWKGGAERLTDKSSSYEVLAVRDNLGIARWRSEFTVIESGRCKALDCVFLVEFDENGNCRLFREWWHIRSLDEDL